MGMCCYSRRAQKNASARTEGERRRAGGARPARPRARAARRRPGAAHQQRAEGVQRQARRAGRLHLRQPRRVLQAPGRAHQPARAPRRCCRSVHSEGRSQGVLLCGETTASLCAKEGARACCSAVRPQHHFARTHHGVRSARVHERLKPCAIVFRALRLAPLPAASHQQSLRVRRAGTVGCCAAWLARRQRAALRSWRAGPGRPLGSPGASHRAACMASSRSRRRPAVRMGSCSVAAPPLSAPCPTGCPGLSNGRVRPTTESQACARMLGQLCCCARLRARAPQPLRVQGDQAGTWLPGGWQRGGMG
jgi:hypothetical protein